MKIGLTELALNAAKAAGRVIMTFADGDEVIVESDLQHDRLRICDSCTHYSKGKCGKCGCFTILKSKLSSESCPVGKW